ncbi:MAG: hypothetical protein MHMPM18_001775 [Marteilia pararefringens]
MIHICFHPVSFNVTLRDDSNSTVNCGIEATLDQITAYFDRLHIGDVIQIKNCSIVSKTSNRRQYMDYLPETRSACHLLVDLDNESTRVNIANVNSSTAKNMAHLLNNITKDETNYYDLSDLLDGCESGGEFEKNGMNVNVFVVVKRVGKVKEISTKYGTLVNKRDCRVFDRSVSDFILTIWGDEQCFVAEFWDAFNTVLFVADCRVSFDQYKKRVVCCTTSKTLITAQPCLRQTAELAHYAKLMQQRYCGESAEEDATDNSSRGAARSDSSLDVSNGGDSKKTEEIDFGTVTICSLKGSLIEWQKERNLNIIKSATFFGYLTDLNCDKSTCIYRMCSICRKRIDRNLFICSNFDCPRSSTETYNENSLVYRYCLIATITDMTGSLQYCQISDRCSEKLLNTTAEEFLKLDEEKHSTIRFSCLFDLKKIIIKIEPAINSRGFVNKIVRIESATYKESIEALNSNDFDYNQSCSNRP